MSMRRDPDGLLCVGELYRGVSHVAPRSGWSASGSRIGEPSLVRPIEVITGGRERERNTSMAEAQWSAPGGLRVPPSGSRCAATDS